MRKLSGVVCLAALLLSVSSCDDRAKQSAVTELRGTTMGTTFSVKVVEIPETIRPQNLQADIGALLKDLNGRMSTYDRNSELSRFNANGSTQWVPASSELLAVLQEALHVSAISNGAFDVTVGPLVNLWGFGPTISDHQPPSNEDIGEALRKVGYQHLHVRTTPPAISKDRPELYVDLSAIAKGYAVDQVALLLDSLGVRDYLIEIGGEVRGRGRSARGRPWRIGIEKPVSLQRAVYSVVNVSDVGVATSGDYRNYFERGGERFSHTIDPRSGRPITHKLASVTVVDPSAMRADALATALMVLGPEAGYRLAEKEGLAALFIVRDEARGFTDKATRKFEQYLAKST